MSTASDQITEYLSIGGLFNPEMMNQLQHRAVRDTLIKARDDIQRLESENAALREDKERMNFLQRVAEEGGFQCFGVEDSELLDFEFSNHGNQTSESVRAAIDAARKEAQP